MSLLVVYLLVPSVYVIADYEVEVTVHSYQNPTGRCDGCRQAGFSNPGCCDETIIRPPSLSCETTVDTCDTAVDYCIRDLRSTTNGCPADQTVLSNFAVEETNEYSISPTFLGVDNPLIVTGRNKSWTGIQLYLQIQDALLEFNGFSRAVLIDSVAIDIDIQVGAFSEPMLFIGSAGIVQVNASFEVRCAENFMGWDCLTLCPDFQSCTECGLPEFVGDYCQISLDCACNASNLRCVHASNGSFVCVCMAGFTGEDCETPIDYCGSTTCSDNGSCRNIVGGFSCACDRGYTGIRCEAEVDECVSVTCNGNGLCVDGLNSFLCECYKGYAGVLCEEEVLMVHNTSTPPIMEYFIMDTSTSASSVVYYIIGGVSGILALVIISATVLIVVCTMFIMKSRKKSAENLGTRKNRYEDSANLEKEQKLNAIT